jgi:hypothetical protein
MRSRSNVELYFRFCTLLLCGAIFGCTSESDAVFDIAVRVDEPVEGRDFLPEGDVLEGPCGRMRLIKARSLSQLSQHDFSHLKRVLEFAESGEVIAEWRTPVESYVTGIDADWLTVSSTNGFISINRKGDIRQDEHPDTREDTEHFGRCPDPVYREFLGGNATFLGCWKLKDGTTNEIRLLAYRRCLHLTTTLDSVRLWPSAEVS